MFGKKKVEKPKNALSLVLFEYDLILNNELKNILTSIKLKKKINSLKAGKIFDNVSLKFDLYINDISKDKLKLDYRSDKARDLIIEMLNQLKYLFIKLKDEDFDITSSALSNINDEFENVYTLRETIRKKLKDLEYEYI
jgi:hypothetical protein